MHKHRIIDVCEVNVPIPYIQIATEKEIPLDPNDLNWSAMLCITEYLENYDWKFAPHFSCNIPIEIQSFIIIDFWFRFIYYIFRWMFGQQVLFQIE